jgi:hypothetical protein
MKRVLIPISLAAVLFVTVISLEIIHFCHYGDTVTFGAHTDIVLGNSDISKGDTYLVRLWNLSIRPIDLDGCFESNDVIGAPPSVLFRWDIQRWNPARNAWDSLRGADTWVPKSYGGYWSEMSCRPVRKRVNPLHKLTIAWVYNGWVRSGEPIRVAVHKLMSAGENPDNIIFTRTFAIRKKAR